MENRKSIVSLVIIAATVGPYSLNVRKLNSLAKIPLIRKKKLLYS
jgi:hypothetical protein